MDEWDTSQRERERERKRVFGQPVVARAKKCHKQQQQQGEQNRENKYKVEINNNWR